MGLSGKGCRISASRYRVRAVDTWLDALREREHDAPVMWSIDPSAGIDAGCLLPSQERICEDVVECMSKEKTTGHRGGCSRLGGGTTNGQYAFDGERCLVPKQTMDVQNLEQVCALGCHQQCPNPQRPSFLQNPLR